MFDSYYQLEYSERYSDTTHHETTIKEGYQYCTSLQRVFELLISENYTNFMLTVGCITIAIYCKNIGGLKYLILMLEICMVEGILKAHMFSLKYCPSTVWYIIFRVYIKNDIFEVRGEQIENI